jgi:hypothetical protein
MRIEFKRLTEVNHSDLIKLHNHPLYCPLPALVLREYSGWDFSLMGRWKSMVSGLSAID